jgi:hypothetical protein
MNQRVLLLVGSAKKPHSTSESLGTYLIERFRERGAEIETLLLPGSLWVDDRRAELIAATERADIIALAFPLYIDTLPFIVTRTLEIIADHRRAYGAPKRQRLVAIVNCGFPEAQHCAVAIKVCEQFARETGMEWLGGLALGGGEAINGQPLHELGGMMHHAVTALDLSADAIANDQPVPQHAMDLMGKLFIPKWLYVLMGGRGWKQRAKKFGAEKKLHAKPYGI